jgi:hypothetical protein
MKNLLAAGTPVAESSGVIGNDLPDAYKYFGSKLTEGFQVVRSPSTDNKSTARLGLGRVCRVIKEELLNVFQVLIR